MTALGNIATTGCRNVGCASLNLASVVKQGQPIPGPDCTPVVTGGAAGGGGISIFAPSGGPEENH